MRPVHAQLAAWLALGTSYPTSDNEMPRVCSVCSSAIVANCAPAPVVACKRKACGSANTFRWREKNQQPGWMRGFKEQVLKLTDQRICIYGTGMLVCRTPRSPRGPTAQSRLAKNTMAEKKKSRATRKAKARDDRVFLPREDTKKSLIRVDRTTTSNKLVRT